MHRFPIAALISTLAVATIAPCYAAAVKKKPVPKPYTKGQKQLAGGDGKFGVVYSLKDGWNEELISATYSVDPFIGYGYVTPGPNQKLLIVDFAIKNALPDSLFYNAGSRYDAFDQHGTKFDFQQVELTSNAGKEFGPTLNPGQGLGQTAMHDALRMVFIVNSNSVIKKITINQGRRGTSDDIVRYFMTGATKAVDGGDGDSANTIAPLPANVQDPSDPTGATAIDPGNGGKPGAGTVCPSGVFGFTVDSFADANDGMLFEGNPPEDGKKFVFVTLTIKNLALEPQAYFDAVGLSPTELADSDGQTYPVMARFAKSHDTEFTGEQIAPSTPVTVRCLFQVPKDATITRFTTSANSQRVWSWDLKP